MATRVNSRVCHTASSSATSLNSMDNNITIAIILTGVSHADGNMADSNSTIFPGFSSKTSSTSNGIKSGTGTDKYAESISKVSDTIVFDEKIKKIAEEERIRRAEEERARKLEEERKRKIEEEQLRKIEEERKRKAEAERLRKEEEERRRKVEEEWERKEEEEEKKKKAEEERLRKEKEVKKQEGI